MHVEAWLSKEKKKSEGNGLMPLFYRSAFMKLRTIYAPSSHTGVGRLPRHGKGVRTPTRHQHFPAS